MTIPGYWFHETTGVLRPVVERYIHGHTLELHEIRDDDMPLELTKYPISHLPGASLMFDCDDVEDLVLRLAHEIYILTFEREAFLEEYRKPR